MTCEYRLFYSPFYDFTLARCEHANPDARIAADVRRLVRDIDQNGLNNPLFVTMHDDFEVVHPGKCRVKALKLLGHDTAPALVYVPSGVNRIPRATDRISPADAADLFRDDLVCEWDDRFFAVKRRSRPGR